MTHRRRRSSDRVKETIIVETTDGARLRCSVATVGRGTEPRWMILDAKGEQFVGPRIGLDRSQAGVQQLINDWWTSRGRSDGSNEGDSKDTDAAR